MQLRNCLPMLAIAAAIALPNFDLCRAEPLLKVDFGAGGVPSPIQPGFTGVTGNPVAPLHNETIGAYTVMLEAEGSSGPGGFHLSGNSNNIGAGVRSLFGDYYYNNSSFNGEGIILTLGGFQASTQYDVTLWSYDADQIFSPTNTDWSPIGNTTGTSGQIVNFATPYPTTLADRSTTLQLTSTNGTLEIFGTTSSGGGGTRLNGVRVSDGANDLLSLDFNRASQPASPVQATYSGMSGEVSQSSASQQIGDYVVTVEGQGFYNTTSSNADSVDAGVRDFFRDYYYNNAIDLNVGIDLTIDGVQPNTDYELRLWSYDADNFSATPTIWEPAGNTTGQTGNVTNVQEPFPTSLTEYDTIMRVRSTTTSLELKGSTLSGTGGTRLNGFELSLAPEGVNGDYNADDIVEAGDYVTWRKFENTDIELPNDPHGGTIGEDQYNTWHTNFGMTSSGGGGSPAVPEPATIVPFMMFGIMMSQWRTLCPPYRRR
jgi:hypothetical protein